MRRYKVTGVFQDSGKHATKFYTVKTREEAELEAQRDNVLIDQIELVEEFPNPIDPASHLIAPRYRFMLSFGLINIAIGSFAILCGLANLIAPSHPGDQQVGMYLIAGGALWTGIGESIRVLRDIARNTWH